MRSDLRFEIYVLNYVYFHVIRTVLVFLCILRKKEEFVSIRVVHVGFAATKNSFLVSDLWCDNGQGFGKVTGYCSNGQKGPRTRSREYIVLLTYW